MQFAAGRSSFGAPAVVHLHALVFFGWVFLYLAQNVLATTGNIRLHRRLGWVAAGWVGALLVMGFFIAVRAVRNDSVPFIFQPQHFLIFNPLSVVFFAGLTAAAIVRRHETAWHRRLHFCGMTLLLGPGVGRLLPLPLLIPYAFEAAFAATLLFPAAGIVADLRRSGRVHPGWWWGLATIAVYFIAQAAITNSSLGAALYTWTTAGTPGAAQPGMAFPPMPPMT
jgi:hypothetical protein